MLEVTNEMRLQELKDKLAAQGAKREPAWVAKTKAQIANLERYIRETAE
jgi:hypothetical protein